jgi:Bacterial Ig-like domain (group 3)
VHHHAVVLARGLALLAATIAVVVLVVGASATIGGTTSYTPGTVEVDGGLDGPWNTSQGDGSSPSFPTANLFPTYTPTSISAPPNLAVYAGSAASPAAPYPSGTAGAPGPLAGYCKPGYPANGSSSVQSQPAGVDLPMAPYYFPDVTKSSAGALTGYFDWRPKDADEATVVAKSTDGGKTWQAEGMALDQNGGYCPTADTNDDGQGHPYVMSVGGRTNLYTLQRQAGDYPGVGLLVHQVDASAANPLAGVPASEPVGIDPNTFATGAVSVPATGGTGVPIPVSTLGTAGSPQDIVAGPYEDLSSASPSTSIITCTGAGSGQLTGCTAVGGLAVSSGDDLVQVIATANPGAGKTFSVPQGPPVPTDGSGGLATLNISNGNPQVSPLTTYILNVNAPNRVYIDGATVYCAQSNANPTNKIENCTTTQSGGLTVHQGDPITADPILPKTATMTSGLIAPDGIVGTIPSYPGAPAGSTVVLYTEKILSYFIEGTTTSKITLPTSTIDFAPSVTGAAEPLPSSGPFTVYLGTAVGQPIQAITCASAGVGELTGCSGGTGTVASGNWIGAPNAAIAPYSVLSQTGEGTNGSSKGPEKLFGNNEDLTVLRAAYTTDGVDFTDLGAISGTTSGTGSTTGDYDDVSNPLQQASPSTTSPTNLPQGAADTYELRYVGSRGTIVVNPDGSYGMFLSGAWATDGDSDAFNQIFYTSSTDGKHWTTPVVVLSTDYTFSASAAQQGTLNPLGISAYYSGRAYGPSVVQNADGTLTMVFSGYRVPKPVATVGDVLGTSGGYTVGADDPALYRNILTMTLTSSTSPPVPTSTTLAPSPSPAKFGTPVSITATVSVPAPGTGLATGAVSFTDDGAGIAGCSGENLSDSSPDTATCVATLPPGEHLVAATYSGDSNYATSSGSVDLFVYTSSINGKSNGPVNVSSGEALEIFPGSTVTGPVRVKAGGAIDVEGATLSGPLDASGATAVRLCSSAVGGPLDVEQTTGPVVLADGSATCGADTFGGPVDVEKGTGGVTAIGNKVGGPMRVTGNTGPVTVTGNTVGGPLTVTGNTQPVVDTPNTSAGPQTIQ